MSKKCYEKVFATTTENKQVVCSITYANHEFTLHVYPREVIPQGNYTVFRTQTWARQVREVCAWVQRYSQKALDNVLADYESDLEYYAKWVAEGSELELA